MNGESDQLPGLIVDRFGDVLVMQLRNAGMERRRAELIRLLAEELQPHGIYERSDVEARQDEGLEPRTGAAWGDVPAVVEVIEDDVRFEVSLSEGQKTGFYLDQRDNRRRLRALVRPDDRVLDVYSYVGSFGLHAARAGASVLCVDKDSAALALAERAARRNDVWPRLGVRWGDAIEVMRALADEKRMFSHIVLDPPTLVKRKEDLPRTRRLFVEMCGCALSLLVQSVHVVRILYGGIRPARRGAHRRGRSAPPSRGAGRDVPACRPSLDPAGPRDFVLEDRNNESRIRI